MYVVDGIAYAGEEKKPIRVKMARPINDHTLLIRFSTGEERVFDVAPLFNFPAFAPLKEKTLFDRVYVDYGTIVWPGDIDYCPNALYGQSRPLSPDDVATPEDISAHKAAMEDYSRGECINAKDIDWNAPDDQ